MNCAVLQTIVKTLKCLLTFYYVISQFIANLVHLDNTELVKAYNTK